MTSITPRNDIKAALQKWKKAQEYMQGAMRKWFDEPTEENRQVVVNAARDHDIAYKELLDIMLGED